MKTLYQQVFPLVNVEQDAVRTVEKGVAKLPKLQCLVRVLLVFYLFQSALAKSSDVTPELFTLYELKIDIDAYGESILVLHVLKDAIVNDK